MRPETNSPRPLPPDSAPAGPARKADPNGDRVTITMSGKFLPYRTY